MNPVADAVRGVEATLVLATVNMAATDIGFRQCGAAGAVAVRLCL